MATRADVRRIALSLPETEEGVDRFAFSVRNKGKLKGFCWVWMERVNPKKPRVPNPGVLAVRVANLGQKDLLLTADPVKFFTEPHYNGFPAILVRLDEVSVADLKLLLPEAWRCLAPKELVRSVVNKTEPKRPAPVATKRSVPSEKASVAKRVTPAKRAKRQAGGSA